MTSSELQAWRLDLKFTERDMSAILGLHLTYYQRLEQGRHPIDPRLDNLKKYLKPA